MVVSFFHKKTLKDFKNTCEKKSIAFMDAENIRITEILGSFDSVKFLPIPTSK